MRTLIVSARVGARGAIVLYRYYARCHGGVRAQGAGAAGEDSPQSERRVAQRLEGDAITMSR